MPVGTDILAAGNWGDSSAAELLEQHLWRSPLLVAEHAAWALARLQGDAGKRALERAIDAMQDSARRRICQRAMTERK